MLKWILLVAAVVALYAVYVEAGGYYVSLSSPSIPNLIIKILNFTRDFAIHESHVPFSLVIISKKKIAKISYKICDEKSTSRIDAKDQITWWCLIFRRTIIWRSGSWRATITSLSTSTWRYTTATPTATATGIRNPITSHTINHTTSPDILWLSLDDSTIYKFSCLICHDLLKYGYFALFLNK